MKLIDAEKMKKLLLFFLCIWFVSCSDDKATMIPEGVLAKEKMALVMTDMHLLEASMNLNISNAIADNKSSDMEKRAMNVLKKNGITKQQFETSFAFYTSKPELLSEVYKEVVVELSKLQAKVANEKNPEPAAIVPPLKEENKVNDKKKPDPKDSVEAGKKQAVMHTKKAIQKKWLHNKK